MRNYRPWTGKELAEAKRRKQAGETVPKIAAALGRSWQSVQSQFQYVDATGYRRKKLSRYAHHLKRLHAKGLSDYQICGRLGVRRETVRAWRKRLGLPTNPTLREDRVQRFQRFLDNHDTDTLADLRWTDHRIRRMLEADRCA